MFFTATCKNCGDVTKNDIQCLLSTTNCNACQSRKFGLKIIERHNPMTPERKIIVIGNMTRRAKERFQDRDSLQSVVKMVVAANSHHKWNLTDEEMEDIFDKGYVQAIAAQNKNQ